MTALAQTPADRLARILTDHLFILPEQVTPEARIMTDLGADSLDTVEILMAVEEEFEIEISDDAADAIGTVADYLAIIDRLTADRPKVS